MILRRIIESLRRQNWFDVTMELLIVIFGVYIGIYLGDVQTAQQRARDTNLALAALESELRSDLERLAQIVELQEAQVANRKRVTEILLDDEFDRQEFGRLVIAIPKDNFTYFPSKAAYSAMQAGGFLAALPDEELRLRITRLFEREFVRQDYNATIYDDLANDFRSQVIANHWNRARNELMGDREASAAVIRNSTLVLGEQGEFYLSFLKQTIVPEIEAVLKMIDGYQAKANP